MAGEDLTVCEDVTVEGEECADGNTPILLREDSVKQWTIFGSTFPKGEVVFFSQIVIIYVVIISCIINLSREVGDNTLWTALLSSCLGYLLPSPSIKTYSPVSD